MDLSAFCQNNLLYTQESLSRYKPGGYHPVTLGDTFKHGRYEIHHKLGYGGFSTVWLAKDRERDQWVSLKIMTANASESGELRNLRLLQNHAGGSLSSKYIVQLLDDFTHDGPNGVHQCLVFELLGPTVDMVLRDYHEGHDKLEPEDILRMSTQLLKAVRFIHSAGMCHGGKRVLSYGGLVVWRSCTNLVSDISGRNMAFTCNTLLNSLDKEFFDVLGFPKIELLARIDGAPLDNGLPTQLVEAAEWVDWTDEDVEDIRLLDFGESFLKGEQPEKLAQPDNLRVPETLFTDCFDYRLDLWRAGCMIYAFVFTIYPFWFDEEEYLVFQMIGFVERLPVEWESQWKEMKTRSGRDLEIKEDHEMSKFERKFAKNVHDPELQPLLPVAQRLIRFLPASRISAAEALEMLCDKTQE
ncbi:unnamed protein product [Penicillium egyptiacum]|uniref:non-specific serine/threonine protein kinase n=1 Tax=Penicillium egyptiacum TaxID=1303716 RepID=A0A9W4KJN2_9EURO|nr:unnamed protein product [Penicillium egyptiacum]